MYLQSKVCRPVIPQERSQAMLLNGSVKISVPSGNAGRIPTLHPAKITHQQAKNTQWIVRELPSRAFIPVCE